MVINLATRHSLNYNACVSRWTPQEELTSAACLSTLGRHKALPFGECIVTAGLTAAQEQSQAIVGDLVGLRMWGKEQNGRK
jgi:hypothetical protein